MTLAQAAALLTFGLASCRVAGELGMRVSTRIGEPCGESPDPLKGARTVFDDGIAERTLAFSSAVDSPLCKPPGDSVSFASPGRSRKSSAAGEPTMVSIGTTFVLDLRLDTCCARPPLGGRITNPCKSVGNLPWCGSCALSSTTLLVEFLTKRSSPPPSLLRFCFSSAFSITVRVPLSRILCAPDDMIDCATAIDGLVLRSDILRFAEDDLTTAALVPESSWVMDPASSSSSFSEENARPCSFCLSARCFCACSIWWNIPSASPSVSTPSLINLTM
mmetsp:Transcript_34287/g.90503  ORF Transcript_34287/g.90503 Transcript_34287/m.90503 type:complete len:276 (+) Transcript_34287:108-935(+)